MYQVTIYNGSTATVIHQPTRDQRDPHLPSCSLVQGSAGEIDSLTFSILPNNPGFDLLESRITLVTVSFTVTDALEFSGRVLTITPQMDEDGMISKEVVCEERKAFLCDSIQPYLAVQTFTGDAERTGVEEFLDLLLANHNAQVEEYKRIYRGTVTVQTSTGNVTKGLNYETTWDCIKSKLLDSLGGEILLYDAPDGKLYLDYAPELGSRGETVIQMGKNMRSISRAIDPTAVITRLIPLGASLEEDPDARVTIASVNGGKLYLDDTAAQAKYGVVCGTVTWEDVTEPKNLLAKGQAWLQTQALEERITLSALDLSILGLAPDSIQRFNYYRVIHAPVGLDAYLRVVKRTLNVVSPSDISYELGQRSRSMASVVTGAAQTASDAGDAMAAINAELSKTVASIIAANASIGTLTAGLANVETLLAGSAGVGNLQAIHLTGDNVVIDDALITDAMIANLSAGKLTAGTLYTSLVKIVSDQEEHLVIDGATLQLKDAAGTVRVQIGKDASGDYSYYLWDAQGKLMWSPTGVTADGLNDGIIRDINVAEDAAISGDKLNISSVAQKLNEDGSLTVDAGQVTIDGTKLDVAYKQVTQDLQGTQEALDGLQVGGRNLLPGTKAMAGYSKSDNVTTASDGDGFTLARFAPVDAPDWNSVNTRPAISFSSLRNQTATFSLLVRSEDWAELNGDNSHGLLIAFCLCSGDSLARTLYATQGYYTTPLSPAWTKVTTTVELTDSFFNRGSGTIDESTRFYVQVYNYSIYSMEVKEFKLELGTMATDWTPAPEDTEEALSEITQRTTALETSLSVVQGQITSKVWESDITQITDPLGQQLTTLEDQYSQINQTVDGITLSVGNLQTTTDALGSSISDVQGELALKVGRDDNDQIVSMLNASADQINLTGQRITIDSPNFKLAADGTIIAVNADLSGKVTATSGSIGNWVINQAGIVATREYDGLQYRYVIQAPSTDLGSWYSFLACQYRASSDDPWSYAFQVGYDGDISGRGLALSEDLEVAGGATVGGNLTASYMKSTGYLDAADRIRCSAGSISIGSGSGVLLLPSGDAYLQGSGNLKADGNGAFAGSLSTYGYLVPRMQHGSVSVTVTANTWKTVSVTFPKAFPGTPDVTVTPRHNSQETNISYKLTALSASGFTLGLYCSGGGTYAVHWTAMYG